MTKVDWKDIKTAPTNGSLFVALNIELGLSSMRVVHYDEADECLTVPGRNEHYDLGSFTHWCGPLNDVIQDGIRGQIPLWREP